MSCLLAAGTASFFLCCLVRKQSCSCLCFPLPSILLSLEILQLVLHPPWSLPASQLSSHSLPEITLKGPLDVGIIHPCASVLKISGLWTQYVQGSLGSTRQWQKDEFSRENHLSSEATPPLCSWESLAYLWQSSVFSAIKWAQFYPLSQNFEE